jgi:hypothetical protein
MTIFRLTSETVIEPTVCEDVFCPITVRIERVGPCHRLVFGSPGLTYDDGRSDRRDLQVCARLILTDEALHALVKAIPQYLHTRSSVPAQMDREVRVN